MNNLKYAYAPHCDMWDGMAKSEKRRDNGLHKLASQMFPNVKDGENSEKTREIMAGEWDTISNAVIKTASGDFFVRQHFSYKEIYILYPNLLK